MIATSGLHDSFSRIKKLAFAIRHARWNVGNFKRCIEYESIANVRDIVDVTCRILSISYGCNADRFRPRFVSVGGMKTVAAHFKITHCITLKCFYYDGCKDWKKQEGAKYVIADTAITAFDSVTWHLQRCHCHKIGLKSFSSTNYYSYVFRRDLVPRSIFITKIIYPIMFAFSYCFTRMFKKRI